MSVTISGTGAITGVSTNYSFDKKVSIGGSVGIGTTVLNVNGDIEMHRAGGGGTRALHIGDGTTDGRGLIVSNYDRTNADVNLLGLIGRWNNNQVASILFQTGSDTVNKKDGSIIFRTRDGQAGGIPTRMTLTSEGNIGIGTSTPTERLVVEGNVKVQNSSDASEYLTINYQGLNFQNTGAGSSTSSSAHILDDYEEGTWTPVYSGATSAGTYTYTTQTGLYTKIGNRVTVDFKLLNITTGSAGSGNLHIRGLPFTVGTTDLNAQGSARFSQHDVADSTIGITLQPTQNDTVCQIVLTRDNTSNIVVSVSNKQTDGADIYGSVTYNVD